MFNKKISNVLIGILLVSFLLSSFTGCKAKADGEKQIAISGAWALYPMMCVWADEYQQTHNVKIEVAGGGAGKGMSDVLMEQVDIAMCSRPVTEAELKQGAFYIAVTKDAVIATINAKNPVIKEIFKYGLSRQDLEKIFFREVKEWGTLFGKNLSDDTITVLGRSDASGAAKVWANYLGKYTQSEIQDCADANYNGDMNLANGVKQQKNAIGFNNLNYTYNMEDGSFAPGIRPVPLDLNGNNKLDPKEDFYQIRKALVKNVSRGVYPSPPARKEYLVAKGDFSKTAKKFVNWILTDGQQYVSQNGYVILSSEMLKQELNYLKQGKRK